MQLREVMTRDVEVIGPDATLEEAARKMDALDVGPLPVCENDRLVGMITDRDVTVRATAAGRDPTTTRVREAMTEDLVFCREEEDVETAAQLMKSRQVRRLPVLNEQHRVVGIVSLGDLAVQAGDERLSGGIPESVSEPSQPDR